MLNFSLEPILYPKAITLITAVAMVLVWLTYYCYRLKQKNEVIWGTHHLPYIAYSICIVAWIGSNAYFHTDLLPILGASSAVFMAKLANLASFSAFAFACYFSYRLLPDQLKNKVRLWQQTFFIILTFYSLYINFLPDLTIKHVEITGPSQFVIEFGPHTKYFFIGLMSFLALTLANIVALRANSSKLILTKTNYMIAGILVFMLSTLVMQVAMPFFLQNFSLTWLPPALSISEMMFVGYAL
nr:hybrid sensor histidine kinase/response regulator [Vibrio anguillarum]